MNPLSTPIVHTFGVINVSTVPKLSPFRYPGGKTWLVPYIRLWLRECAPINNLIEPFAGGGIVSLTAVSENLSNHAIMAEKDPAITAVWKTIFSSHAKWLADSIGSFQITLENVRTTLGTAVTSTRERAFVTILRNRVQRGGIMAEGAGLMKEGENGRGLSSRWYPETLRKRVFALSAVANRFTVIEGDGLDVIREYSQQKRIAFFIDPPYTVAGRRLYTFSDIDHENLFKTLSTVEGTVLMTYDYCPDIYKLAARFGFEAVRIPMKSTHHVHKYELLIGKDLGWLRHAK